MRSIGVALVALVLAGAGPAPDAPPPRPAPTPGLPGVTAESRALATELVQAMEAEARMSQMLTLMRGTLVGIIKNGTSKPADEVGKIVDEVLMPEMTSRVGELTASIVEIYASTYTADDMRQILAFYRSPIGRRVVELGPKINALSVAAGQAWGRRVAADAIQHHAEELRRRGVAL